MERFAKPTVEHQKATIAASAASALVAKTKAYVVRDVAKFKNLIALVGKQSSRFSSGSMSAPAADAAGRQGYSNRGFRPPGSSHG